MITMESQGSWSKTEAWLRACSKNPTAVMAILDRFGLEGAAKLSQATPFDTGGTAEQWYYMATMGPGGFSLVFSNGNVIDGVPVAIILQYGHGTGTGGFVPGRDYINGVIKPLFDRLDQEIWKAVTRL